MAQTPIMRRSATALIAGSRRAPIPRATALSRTYASFSRNRADREMSRMMKAGPKEPTMSVGYKEAAKSMFADGNSPLFPGSSIQARRHKHSLTDALNSHFCLRSSLPLPSLIHRLLPLSMVPLHLLPRRQTHNLGQSPRIYAQLDCRTPLPSTNPTTSHHSKGHVPRSPRGVRSSRR